MRSRISFPPLISCNKCYQPRPKEETPNRRNTTTTAEDAKQPPLEYRERQPQTPQSAEPRARKRLPVHPRKSQKSPPPPKRKRNRAKKVVPGRIHPLRDIPWKDFFCGAGVVPIICVWMGSQLPRPILYASTKSALAGKY